MRPVLVAAFALALVPAVRTDAAPPEPRVLGWAKDAVPRAPANFRVTPFARGLDHPRTLLVLPNGDVLVALAAGFGGASRSPDRVLLLRPSVAGVADLSFPLIEGLPRPYGLALRRDRLYVGASDGVYACPYLVGQTRLHGECHRLADIPDDDGRGQWMRALALSPDEHALYVGVGARSETEPGGVAGEAPARAAVLVVRPDGKGLRTYAAGLRSPAGLAVEPASGSLWAAVAERGAAGEAPVPDALLRVLDGAFYGWPYAYAGAHADPSAPGARADLVAASRAPDVALPAAAGAEGLLFYGRDHFPRNYRGGAFVALHGPPPAGGRVVFVPFRDGAPSGPAEDFLTGFAPDGATGEVYGRPSGLALATDGTMLVADEAGGAIFRVTFKCAACTPDPEPPRRARPAAR